MKKTEVIKIIARFICINEEDIESELLDYNVLGNKINLTPMQILSLFSILEEELGIKLSYDSIKELEKITFRVIIDLCIKELE